MRDEQLSLLSRFGNAGHVGAPYQPSSETSRDAAIAKAERIESEREACYEAVRRAGRAGLTWDECAEQLGIPVACSGRFTELRTAGRIVKTDRRRPTRTGASATVYIAADLETAS